MPINDPNEKKYEVYREAARRSTLTTLCKMALNGQAPRCILNGFDMTFIGDVAIRASEIQWQGSYFPWRKVCGQNRPYVKRFEIAIWMGSDLEALCVGRASRRKENITIHFIERGGKCNDLKGWIARTCIATAEDYALLIGRDNIFLRDPLPGALPLYQAMNFTLARQMRGSTYYGRSVGP